MKFDVSLSLVDIEGRSLQPIVGEESHMQSAYLLPAPVAWKLSHRKAAKASGTLECSYINLK